MKKNGPSRQSQATARPHGRRSAAGKAAAIASLMSIGEPLGERNGEDTPFVDALLDFVEARGSHELVDLGLGAASHDPRLPLAMAGQHAGNELDLRMPGLAGINEVTARRDGRRQSFE